MHLPILLAHGELLPSMALIIVLAGASGLVCLMFAYRYEQRRTSESRRTSRRFLVAVLVCIAVALLSPLIAQMLH